MDNASIGRAIHEPTRALVFCIHGTTGVTMRSIVLSFLIATCMCACSTSPSSSKTWIEPIDAIFGANADPANGVRGEFVMTVRASASVGSWSYLNSELDYRDQRNLTVRLPSSLLPSLEAHLGLGLAQLENRRIVVEGVARRVRIDFLGNGAVTGKYYYQTQVDIERVAQVRVIE
jgi:hypothetical protein